MEILLLLSPASGADFFDGYGFYLGDPHVHTGHSADGGSSDIGDGCSGCGAFSEVMDIARSNGLDFVALSEHVNGSVDTTAAGFEAVAEATRAGHDPEGGFLTVMGAELWFQIGTSMVGHKNLYIFADNEALEGISLADVQINGESPAVEGCEDIWSWAASVEDAWGSALLVPHHPAAEGQMTTDWSCHLYEAAEQYAPVAEIYSRHGSSDWRDSSYDALWLDYSKRGALGFAMDPAGMALRIGFLAGTDSHDTNPGGVCEPERYLKQHPYGGGLTVAVIPESDPFDREHLHEAMRTRQTYATSGPLLPAVVRYSSGGALLGGMGEFVGLPDAQPLDVTLTVPPELSVFVLDVTFVSHGERIAMVDAGEGRFTLSLDAMDVPAWAYPEITISGDGWYGAGGCADGGEDSEERIWLSPTWFDASEADLDGDGVTWTEGDCDDGSPETFPGAVEDCDSGLDEDCDGAVDGEDDDCTPADSGEPETRSEPDENVEEAPGMTPIGTPEWSGDGCATVHAASGLASWALSGLLVWRRRKHAGVDAGDPGGLRGGRLH